MVVLLFGQLADVAGFDMVVDFQHQSFTFLSTTHHEQRNPKTLRLAFSMGYNLSHIYTTMGICDRPEQPRLPLHQYSQPDRGH